MASFKFKDTSLSGLKIIQKTKLEDERGHFSRLFCEEELKSIGWDHKAVQANHSFTKDAGTVRGLHLQKAPHAEIKIVNCLRGKLYDVAVDLRPNSPTFMQWEGYELSDENWLSLYIPEGFAHGFQALTDDVQLLYFNSSFYAPDYEVGIHPQDKKIAVNWPLPITRLSDRDRNLGSIDEYLDLIS